MNVRPIISRTRSAGIAKPMPSAPVARLRIAVFTPIQRPVTSRMGPPELPGLIAASIWMKSLNSVSASFRGRMERRTADTTPVVTVSPRRNGLPIAITVSPISRSFDRPSARKG